MFTTTFLIIYVVDKVGIASVGILSAILLLTQSFLDYPLGVISDSIGQRWVIAAGSFVFALADILLILGNTFLDFVPVYVLYGLMLSLFSGAYETWFDNNYSALVTEERDPDRKIYGFLKSRINTFFAMGAVIAFSFGGFLSAIYSREVAFFGHSGAAVLFGIIILFVLKDYYTTDKKTPSISKVLNKFVTTFINGIKFLFSSKKVFYFLSGSIIFSGMWSIWFLLILFVMYFGYTGSDDLAGLLRSIIFLLGILIDYNAAKVIRRITSNTLLPYLFFFYAIVFFGSFALIFWFFPLNNELNIIAVLGVIILKGFGFLLALILLMSQRILIDLVPSEIRNSVYSLIPTLAALFGVPFMIIVGFTLDTINFTSGVLILLGLAIVSTVFFMLYVREFASESSN